MGIKEKLYRINQEIDKYSHIQKKKAKSKVKELRHEEFECLRTHLSTNDKEFSGLVKENLSLLLRDSMEVHVRSSNQSGIRSHTSAIEGKILTNGQLPLHATEVALALLDIQKKFYPKQFTGHIDEFGRTELKMSKSGFSFIGGRVPKTFEASINENGAITMDLAASNFEFFGIQFMNKLACWPFEFEKEKHHQFIANRTKMVQTIKELRAQLLL